MAEEVKKRGRPVGRRDAQPRHRRTGASTSASYTVRQLFDIIYFERVLQQELSDGMDLYRASLTNYKYGKNTPSILTIEELAGLLGYEVKLVKRGESSDAV